MRARLSTYHNGLPIRSNLVWCAFPDYGSDGLYHATFRLHAFLYKGRAPTQYRHGNCLPGHRTLFNIAAYRAHCIHALSGSRHLVT